MKWICKTTGVQADSYKSGNEIVRFPTGPWEKSADSYQSMKRICKTTGLQADSYKSGNKIVQFPTGPWEKSADSY